MTTQNEIKVILPSWILALFDEAGGEGEGGNEGGEGEGGNEGGGIAVVTPAAPAKTAAQLRAAARHIPDSDYPRELRRALESASDRIGELNSENQKHRKTANELKATLATVSSKQTLVDQRAIRAETRAELIKEGAIDTDIVDLLLKASGDAIKIDDKTGEVVGVREAILAYKEKKPSFFKAVTEMIVDKEKTAEEKDAEAKALEEQKKKDDEAKAAKEAEEKKKNATAAGNSPAGGQGGTTTVINGLPDLRGMSRDERKAAMRDYKQGVKRAGRG